MNAISSKYGALKSRVELVAYGENACFKDPVWKTEGLTYPCITPSASRAILESVFWHPPMYYDIVSIEVLKPIIKTLTCVVEPNTYGIDGVLRHYMYLRDVSYHIVADIVMKNGVTIDENKNAIKYMSIFNRRLQKGQTFKAPFLGISQCLCDVREYVPLEDIPTKENYYIGNMLLEMNHKKSGVEPIFMDEAQIKNGVLCNGEQSLEDAILEKTSYRKEEVYIA